MGAADDRPMMTAAIPVSWLGMRGPLLAGPIGSSAMLERVCLIARERAPALVLSALWLGERLATQLPVTVLIEADKRRGARRAVRRAGKDGRRLMVVGAGEELPVGQERAGCILVENLAEISEDAEAAAFLVRLLPVLRSDGLLLALDATKSPAVEARLSSLFLAAAFTNIAQQHPREGALLTIGGRPAAAVLGSRVS
jgi:predicted O-methyltransferase YrrM